MNSNILPLQVKLQIENKMPKLRILFQEVYKESSGLQLTIATALIKLGGNKLKLYE